VLLKNSFQGISRTKFVRKLLNVGSPWALKFTEITALVPFQQPRLLATVRGYTRLGRRFYAMQCRAQEYRFAGLLSSLAGVVTFAGARADKPLDVVVVITLAVLLFIGLRLKLKQDGNSDLGQARYSLTDPGAIGVAQVIKAVLDERKARPGRTSSVTDRDFCVWTN
jgi:hypothetical protein